MEEKSDTMNLEETEKTASKWWAMSLVVVISAARLGQGLFATITGPTLLFLADNTDSEVAAVSVIFTGRSGGMLVGALGFSAVMNRFPGFRPLGALGLGFTISGVMMLVTPFCTKLWLLILIFTVAGISVGFFEAGLQAMYLKLWGAEKSQPYIQSFHFGFSIGSFLAPLLAAPFLNKASEDPDSNPECPNDPEVTTVPYNQYTDVYENSTSTDDGGSINPIAWPYIIIGTYIILLAMTMIALAFLKVEKRLEASRVENIEKRPEEPLGDIYPLLIIIIFFYTFLVAVEVIYQTYLYSMAVCSNLQFTVTEASLLNTLYWAGFGIARGLGIVYSHYFSPRVIILYDLIGLFVCMIFLCIWGEIIPLVIWINTFGFGYFVGSLFSAGVSWSSNQTNVTGSYMVIFFIGIAIGGMGLVPTGGVVFDNEPYNVVYLVFGYTVLMILGYAGMEAMARYRHTADTKSRLEQDQKEHYYTNEAFVVSSTKF